MPIELRNIAHEYHEGSPVLTGIDLIVADGESIAIMGPSGSGKTTLLSIAGLLLEASAGKVLIDGVSVPRPARVLDSLRAGMVAWIFQASNALGRRTVLDNTTVGLLAKGESRIRAEGTATKCLLEVGLGQHAETPAHLLSGGELQRVGIARALSANPRFLFADEPTGQLDSSTSAQVLDVLWSAVRLRGTSLVVATHDASVAALCSRVLEVVNGQLRTT